jgi:hypothetical protein
MLCDRQSVSLTDDKKVKRQFLEFLDVNVEVLLSRRGLNFEKSRHSETFVIIF